MKKVTWLTIVTLIVALLPLMMGGCEPKTRGLDGEMVNAYEFEQQYNARYEELVAEMNKLEKMGTTAHDHLQDQFERNDKVASLLNAFAVDVANGQGINPLGLIGLAGAGYGAVSGGQAVRRRFKKNETQ